MATKLEVQNDPAIKHHYQMLRRRNFSHKDALRLAHGNLLSVTGTDTQIIRSDDDGFGDDNRSRKIFRQRCAAAGVPVTGKYFGQLCREGVTLDPFAQAGTTSEIKKKLQILGYGAHGSINVKVPEIIPEPKKPYRVADSLVNTETVNTIERERLTDLTPKERTQLRKDVRKRITPENLP